MRESHTPKLFDEGRGYPDGTTTVRLRSCLEASGVQATPRNARIDVEDVDHVVATIEPSAVPVSRPKSTHVGRALYRLILTPSGAADTFEHGS
jgi:hypothetical protein